MKSFQIEKTYEAGWKDMIDTVSQNGENGFLYLQGGTRMVRPFTVMFPETEHICENANMTEYNQFLFGTRDYGYQELEPPYFIITASDDDKPEIGFLEYLGTYSTCTGNYAIYYREGR